jgi:hypothetical protein
LKMGFDALTVRSVTARARCHLSSAEGAALGDLEIQH